MLFIYSDMTSHPVNIQSDGQAGIGIGISVLIIQLLRLFLLVLFLLYFVVVIMKKRLKQTLTVINVLLFGLGITIGYLIIN